MYEVDDIKNRLTPVLSKNRVKSAVLFGSHAKGSANENSDIDLLVDSGLRGLDFVGLIELIREALDDREVDVIDVGYVEAGSRIMDEINNTGIVIYG
jgi:predicted nucleotidyltransferase